MNFDFEDPIPLVQKKKKYATFKVTPIGGPEEIIKWRQMNEAKETVYRMRLNSRDERSASFEKELGHKVASPTVSTASWADKKAFAESERERLKKVEDAVLDLPPWELSHKPKQTFLQKVSGFFKRVWANANF